MGIEKSTIEPAVPANCVDHRKGEGAVGTGKELEMIVGGRRGGMADRVDDDRWPSKLGQPVAVYMRRGRRWIGAPHHDRARIGHGAGIEAQGR